MSAIFDDGEGMSQHAQMTVNAEKAFLGSVMFGYVPAADMLGSVPEKAFWRAAHKTVYSAMFTLSDQGRDIDLLTVENELLRVKKLDDAGGRDYLMHLVDFVASPNSWRTYVDTIIEMALRRAYSDRARRINSLVVNGGCADELRAVYEEPIQFGQITRAPIVSIADIEIDDTEDEGISTGFPSLDEKISTRGYPKGQMTIISAYHKGGKSTFMLSSFARMAHENKRVLYATFADLNSVRLKKRLLRNLTGWSKMPTINMTAQEEFIQAKGDLDMWNAWMYDATRLDSGADVETFCRWLEASHSQYRFDAVFVDYAQKMTSSDRKASNTLSEQDVCSTKLSRAFERTGIAGIVGSQITEGGADRKSITKGSRKWEEDAGWVIRIEDESEDRKKIKIPYSRFGVQGKELIMGWNMDRLRFEDRSV